MFKGNKYEANSKKNYSINDVNGNNKVKSNIINYKEIYSIKVTNQFYNSNIISPVKILIKDLNLKENPNIFNYYGKEYIYSPKNQKLKCNFLS